MSHLLVACARRYNGHELWTLLGILKSRGHTFEVVSQETTIRDEITLQPNTIERTLYDVHPDEVNDFDAFCVVSGNMKDTEAYWEDPKMLQILSNFDAEEKIMAAICCSVPTLAPIARGVKVSPFPLIRSKFRLKQFGALLQTVSLTVDGRFITAENQMFTQMWAEEICNALEGLPQEYIMHESPFSFNSKLERKMMPEVRAAIDEARGYKMVMVKDVD